MGKNTTNQNKNILIFTCEDVVYKLINKTKRILKDFILIKVLFVYL